MDARQLLEFLASNLWHDAREHARAVVKRGRQDAAGDPLVGAYAYAQYRQGATRTRLFHLPEPILQPRDRPRVLVVGVNPGYGIDEHMPTLEASLEEYVAFYWDRFASRGRDGGRPSVGLVSPDDPAATRVIDHLKTVEAILSPVLGPQPLGRNAVFCDAIPWKWNNSRDRERKRLQPQLSPEEWRVAWHDHAAARVGLIASALEPEAVLVMGELNKHLYALKLTEGPFTALRRIGDWHGPVVSSLHPNANEKSGAHEAAVTEAVRAVLTADGPAVDIGLAFAIFSFTRG